MKRKRLLIAFAVFVFILIAGFFLTPRVPPDGFAFANSPVKYEYYSRASFKLNPTINIPLPGGKRWTFPKRPPANLEQHIEHRPNIGGVIVLHDVKGDAHWSPIIYPDLVVRRPYYGSAAPSPQTLELPVPYGRTKERREATIFINGRWRKVILPEPPPGVSRPKTEFQKF